MFRTTQDIVELRRWAEARGIRPCRDEGTGRLLLAHPGDGAVCDVGWDEFEPAFVTRRDVLVYDEAPGSERCFVGPEAEAQDFLCGGTGAAAAPQGAGSSPRR